MQLVETFCLNYDLEDIRRRFEKEPWFIDVFLTKPNWRFPYVHICVVGKRVYDNEAIDKQFGVPVEFVQLANGNFYSLLTCWILVVFLIFYFYAVFLEEQVRKVYDY